MQPQVFDVIIVGAGTVGLTLASALKSSSLKIAIVEESSGPATWFSNDYQARVSAINLHSVRVFKELQVWSEMVDCRVSPFRHMRVWDQSEISFDHRDVGQDCLGYIVENVVLQNALWQQVVKLPNITFLCNTKAQSITLEKNHVQLVLQNNLVLQANLLVGADGALSWVREKAGLSYDQQPYQQCAYVTNVRSELSHQQIAWQRFLTTGPLALLPLKDQHLTSIVWSSSVKIAEEEFETKLNQAFQNRLGKLTIEKPIMSFPLVRRHCQRYAKPQVVVIGDAAHTIHPLAGQGVNLGIKDAEVLAEEIMTALKQNKNPGDYNVLRHYERKRKADNLMMSKIMDAFHYTFLQQSFILKTLRNFGITAADRLPFLKKYFISLATGVL